MDSGLITILLCTFPACYELIEVSCTWSGEVEICRWVPLGGQLVPPSIPHRMVYLEPLPKRRNKIISHTKHLVPHCVS